MSEIADRYDPTRVEPHWYAVWEERGYFHADADSPKKPYCIVIPPPNVTGSLHMGHAFTFTLQDVLIRYKRMDGYNALWMPGHRPRGHRHPVRGGAAARERGQDQGRPRARGLHRPRLAVEGRVGRHHHPPAQAARRLLRLGARALHDGSGAVRGGARGLRAPLGRGAHLPGRLHRQLVPALPDRALGPRGGARGSGRRVRLHQVRPADPRHRAAGDQAGRHRGRGASQGQALQEVRGQDARGALGGGEHHAPGGRGRRGRSEVRHRRHQGHPRPRPDRLRDRAPARPADPERHRLRRQDDASWPASTRGSTASRPASASSRTCRRSGSSTASSPTGTRSACATAARRWSSRSCRSSGTCAPSRWPSPPSRRCASGKIKIVPRTWSKTYFHWMENIRDWAISRQLWWGHRIPVWYCDQDGSMHVSRTDLTACPQCGGALRQDTDVLDTWFSSGLWPFSTLGWPESTPELKVFYPTSVLVTGFDILFFWVARMAMLGIKFMGDVPVPPRLHPRPGPRRRGPEDVQVQGERGGSPERHGQVRHRRVPLHARRARGAGARHPPRRGADRGLPELRQQDLERGPAGADQPGGLRSGASPVAARRRWPTAGSRAG